MLDAGGLVRPGVGVDVDGAARDLEPVARREPALLPVDARGRLAFEEREALAGVLEVAVWRRAAGARRQRAADRESLGAVGEHLDDGPLRTAEGVAGRERQNQSFRFIQNTVPMIAVGMTSAPTP